jgi:transposase InsO family protein
VLWCGDLTEIDTVQGKVYCAAVLDLFSRRALGHAFGARHDADLAIAALRQAAARRGSRRTDTILATSRWCDDRLNPVNTRRPTSPPAVSGSG